MVSPKQLALLAAAGVAASLVLAQPARALTAIAQPYLISIDQTRVDAVQSIGHRRWQGYRGGRRGYYRSWRSYGYYRPWRSYAALPYWRRFPGLPYRPWGHYEPCVNCPAFK
jgi:hypothetical protein